MLETLDLSRKLSKDDYRAIVEPLRIRLGELQRATRAAKIPTMIVFEGWDAAGKGTTIGALMQPLDPRGYQVHLTGPPSAEEALRPFLWRHWVRLPAKGQIAIFDRSWYTRVLSDRVNRDVPAGFLPASYTAINAFERTLVDDGAVLLKFWLHISREEQRRRFRKLEKNPTEAWKVTKEDWKENRQYDRYVEAIEEMVAHTGSAQAPWTVVEARNRRFAVAKVFETLAAAWEEALRRPPPPKGGTPARPVTGKTRHPNILARIDLNQTIEPAEYQKALPRLQARMRALEHEIFMHRIPVVIVFEGCDAAGKGGAIRRLTAKLDPRGFRVIPISAPNDVEREHHYLWRFWQHVPKNGHIAIFDRSWYGRVLVERVEGFAAEEEWRRAYREIKEFERELADEGAVIVKIWLQIDKKTQLARFREREQIGYKNWKITGEDWRNRKKWPRYDEAAAEMIERCSTPYAPWTVVPANSKHHARVAILRTVVKAIEAGLKKRSLPIKQGAAAPTARRGGKR